MLVISSWQAPLNIRLVHSFFISQSITPGAKARRIDAMRRTVRRVALGMSTAVFVGCGGDGDGGTAPPTPPATTPRAASVAFSSAPAEVLVAQSVQFTPRVLDAQGATITRPLTWRSSNPGVATVSGDGLVTGVAAGGPVDITVTADGVSGSTPIRVIEDRAALVTITLGAPILDPGFGTQAVVVVRNAAGTILTTRPIVYTSSDTTVATVTATGLVTARAPGQVTITATSDGIAATAPFLVRAAEIASVAVTLSAPSVGVGQTVMAQAVLRDAAGNLIAGRTVVWSASNPALATVSPAGVVTGVAAGGPFTIIATVDGRSGSAPLTVAAAAVASVSVAPTTLSLVQGASGTLTATARDAGGTLLAGRSVAWASTVPGVAVVSAQGLVTAVSVGSTTISATVDGVSASAAVSVTPAPVGSVNVTPTAVTVAAGQSTTLTASPVDAAGNPLSGRTITWTSSNTAIATVNATGRVSGLQPGTAIISATAEGRTGSSTVTVAAASVGSISLSPTSVIVQAGQVLTVRATVRDNTGQIVTGRDIAWQTTNATILDGIDYDSVAVVIGLTPGVAALTASVDGISASAVVTILAPPSNLCQTIAGAEVWSSERVPVFLGRLTNRFDPLSIYNTFGTYGSQFSSLSINNPFGQYGSQFSQLSARNPYTTTPPILIKNGQALLNFTVNSFRTPYVTPGFAATCNFP